MTLLSFLADSGAWGVHNAPLLPALYSLPWLRHGAWSLVLAATVVLLGARRGGERAGGRTGLLAVLVAAWAWLPGPWGLAYWLGLAFQIPSLLSCALALAVLQRAWWRHEKQGVMGLGFADRPHHNLRVWAEVYLGAGVLLGWILLFDTFALFPVSVYAWGFESAAFLLVFALTLLPWVVSGSGIWRVGSAWPAGFAAALFGLGRWPSGNVWDAMLDPWLWLLLNGYALRAAVGHWRSRR